MFPAILRDKLMQVQEELSTSLRSLVLVADGSSQAAPKKTDRLDEVHLNAGADLLNRYQFHWCRIREASERNYRLAQESDTAIQEVAAYVARQNQLVAELQQGLAGLRRTDQQLRELTSRLVDTGAQLQQTESQLALLEDLLDESALQRRMAECRTDARLLEQRKMADLQRLQGGARHEKYLEQV